MDRDDVCDRGARQGRSVSVTRVVLAAVPLRCMVLLGSICICGDVDLAPDTPCRAASTSDHTPRALRQTSVVLAPVPLLGRGIGLGGSFCMCVSESSDARTHAGKKGENTDRPMTSASSHAPEHHCTNRHTVLALEVRHCASCKGGQENRDLVKQQLEPRTQGEERERDSQGRAE